jgi:hypothetical protein
MRSLRKNNINNKLESRNTTRTDGKYEHVTNYTHEDTQHKNINKCHDT